MTDIIERLREHVEDDHVRLCMGRQYLCSCGYDERTDYLLKDAVAEIERWRSRFEDLQAVSFKRASEIARLMAALRGLYDEVVCFVVDPPSAALNHAIEEAGRALEPKP